MYYRAAVLALVISMALSGGCGPQPLSSGATGNTKAVIVGQISTQNAKLLNLMQDGACPDVLVSINGSPVDIMFGDDCSFLIDQIQPAALVELRVELVGLGIAGTVELSDVLEGELIEILVEPTDDSLTISVLRRTMPDPAMVLPEIIEDNNVSLSIPAGLYEQGLEVRGNKFTLVGEAGEGCDDVDGWTEITGEVVILGNAATFQNIKFSGPVELHGNAARFINCCFGDVLEIFGNAVKIGDDDDSDGKDDEVDDDDDDNDDDDDDDNDDDDDEDDDDDDDDDDDEDDD